MPPKQFDLRGKDAKRLISDMEKGKTIQLKALGKVLTIEKKKKKK